MHFKAHLILVLVTSLIGCKIVSKTTEVFVSGEELYSQDLFDAGDRVTVYTKDGKEIVLLVSSYESEKLTGYVSGIFDRTAEEYQFYDEVDGTTEKHMEIQISSISRIGSNKTTKSIESSNPRLSWSGFIKSTCNYSFEAYLLICPDGTFTNWLPTAKFLDGEINDGIYTSRFGLFSVRIPHPPTGSDSDEYEWTYTHVREFYEPIEASDPAVVGVVFGPAAYDHNYYHAVLIQNPMNEPKREYVRDVFRKKVEARSSYYYSVHYEEYLANGRTVYYAVFRGESGYLVLTLTDADSSFYTIEVDVNSASKDAPSLETLIDRKWETLNVMIQTFTMLKTST